MKDFSIPPIWSVPYHRNPNFAGRESLFANLRSVLMSGRLAALTPDISGLGGVGKTQLAVEYAYRHMADYGVVWWVRAEEPTTLAADYAALAGPLALPEREALEQRLVVQAVRRWLTQYEGWLLVFDDARGPAKVDHYLPPGATGHVLITSHNPNWQGVANLLSVPVLERAEAVDFLLKRTGQADKEAATVLAEALGDLPLALEQAGACVKTTGAPLADYLKLFQSRRIELWDEKYLHLNYPHSVATTCSLAMERIGEESPAGADLLNLCTYLGQDGIPRALLSAGEEHVPKSLSAIMTDPSAMDKAMAALQQYSLIEMTGDMLSVHHLVQAVMRDRLPQDARRTWAEAAVHLVDGAFPSESEDMGTWPQCSRLLPHALAAAGHAETLRVASRATARLLSKAGLYLHGRAEFADAKAAHERALTIIEATFGPDHPKKVATSINDPGGMLKRPSDLAEARAACERALAVDEAIFGPDHPRVATDINKLGRVLHGMGDLTGARAAYQRALAIIEAAFGPDHPEVTVSVNNLGSVLHDMGDLAGARAAYQRALVIDEATFGPHHPKVAISVNNLGRVLHNMGDLAGAWAAYQRALAIFEAILPPGHRYIETVRKHLESVNTSIALKGQVR